MNASFNLLTPGVGAYVHFHQFLPADQAYPLRAIIYVDVIC